MAYDPAELANPERRIAAYLLDAVVSAVFISPFILGIQATGGTPGQGSLATFYAWFVPGFLAYYGIIVYLEGQKGVTPGKWLVRIRVRDAESDQVIGWRRDLGRRLMFFVDAIPFYLGFWWMFLDARYQCWHDKTAHSLVVRGRSA